MGAEVMVALALAAASAGASAYNTRRTERKQDQALATNIRNQSAKQRQIDARTNEEVAKLEQSRSADEAAKSRASYGEQLRRNKAAMDSGLTPTIGSDEFKADAAQGTKEVGDYAGQAADLMSRMDAPGMQRQGEGFGFGRLATDTDLISREARGQAYLDELRLRSIRRDPWLDAASQMGMAYAGSGMGAGLGGTGKALGRGGTAVGTAGGGMSSRAGYAPYSLRSPGPY